MNWIGRIAGWFALRRRVSRAAQQSDRQQQQVEELLNRLNELEQESHDMIARQQTEVYRARETIQQLTTQLEATRSELKVLNEVTLPTLVRSHKLLIARYDAEIAVQTRRQVASEIAASE